MPVLPRVRYRTWSLLGLRTRLVGRCRCRILDLSGKLFHNHTEKLSGCATRRSVVVESTSSPEVGPTGPGAPERAPRRLRADARRNVDSLLDAAKSVFATSGVDAPAKEITDLAGVGVGTLYRHFPQRADLVAAVLQRGIDACADAAPALSAANAPGAALAE